MVTQYLDPFFDPNTSCTMEFAVALMLGRRRFDGYYPHYQVEEDPNDPYSFEVAYDHFLEWLDTSIIQILEDEALEIGMIKDDAIDAKADIKADDQGEKEQRIAPVQQIIDDCKQRLVENHNTVLLARKYLRDIDDELANTQDPMLRLDQELTKKTGYPRITIASLERWFKKTYPAATANTSSTPPAPPAPPATPALPAESLLDIEGGMSLTSTKSFLVTFGILLEAFLERTVPQFMPPGGTEVNLLTVAEFLSERSLPSANPALPAEPLLDNKKGMSPASTKSFLATFRILLEAFLDRSGPLYKSDCGTDVKLQTVAKFLSEHSFQPASKLRYLRAQSVSVIEERIKAARMIEIGEVPVGPVLEAIEASTAALSKARATAIKPKTTKQK